MDGSSEDEMSEELSKKTLRVPIEIIAEDSKKLDAILKKLSKGSKLGGKTAGNDSTASEVAEAEKLLAKTSVGDMMTLSKEGIGNLLSIAKNPSGFILSTFMRKFAKGAGAIALAMIIMEAIKFGLNYLTKDGMPWDRRFKRIIGKEVLGFLDRMFKAQLRSGLGRSVITTTIGGLRGGKGQIGGNLIAYADGTGSERLPSTPSIVDPWIATGITLRLPLNGRFS